MSTAPPWSSSGDPAYRVLPKNPLEPHLQDTPPPVPFLCLHHAHPGMNQPKANPQSWGEASLSGAAQRTGKFLGFLCRPHAPERVFWLQTRRARLTVGNTPDQRGKELRWSHVGAAGPAPLHTGPQLLFIPQKQVQLQQCACAASSQVPGWFPAQTSRHAEYTQGAPRRSPGVRTRLRILEGESSIASAREQVAPGQKDLGNILRRTPRLTLSRGRWCPGRSAGPCLAFSPRKSRRASQVELMEG